MLAADSSLWLGRFPAELINIISRENDGSMSRAEVTCEGEQNEASINHTTTRKTLREQVRPVQFLIQRRLWVDSSPREKR